MVWWSALHCATVINYWSFNGLLALSLCDAVVNSYNNVGLIAHEAYTCAGKLILNATR